MFIAEIKINDRTIRRLTAVNIGSVKTKPNTEWRWYELGCGHKMQHDRAKGPICFLVQLGGHAMLCKKSKSK
jgi:hypothetical protein